MNLLKFLILISIVYFVIAFSLSHYEKENDSESKINKYVQKVGGLLLLIIFVYLIITNIDTGMINIYGYKMEKGLVIYILIIFIILFCI